MNWNKELIDFVPRKNDNMLAYRVYDGEAFIVDLVTSRLNKLNVTATWIWQMINGHISARKIAEAVTKEFGVKFQEALEDVLKTLQNMASLGWINTLPSKVIQAETNNDHSEEIFETLREDATKKRIPLVVHFDLTYRCALRCVHCYLVGGNKQLELTTDRIKSVLDQLAGVGTLYLTLSGGEIFLRDDVLDILRYARSLHFAVRLLTSGILIDVEKVKDIAALHPEMIAFSVYDLNPLIHDGITGKAGSLAKTLEVIHAFKQAGVSLKISSVLMDRNIVNYHDIHAFAKELGAQFQVDYRITPKTNGSMEPLKLHIKDSDVRLILNDPIFSKACEIDTGEEYSGIFNTIPCGAGHMSCYITPYGIITPCVQVPIECGDLKSATFLNIWDKSSQLNSFRLIRFSSMPKCANCEFFAYCRPCPGLNLVETGNIATPPIRVCREAEYMKTLNKKRR